MSRAREPLVGVRPEHSAGISPGDGGGTPAVSAAIQTTRSRRDGGERMRVVRMTLFARTHTLEGAAACIPCSYATAKRWQQDFIRDVARYYRCNNGLSLKN